LEVRGSSRDVLCKGSRRAGKTEDWHEIRERTFPPPVYATRGKESEEKGRDQKISGGSDCRQGGIKKHWEGQVSELKKLGDWEMITEKCSNEFLRVTEGAVLSLRED